MKIIRYSDSNGSKKFGAQQPDGSDPRAAVEATVRSVTHPLPHHKVPLRGKHNVSRYMLYSAMMVNVRRIFGKIHRDLHDFLRYLPFLPHFLSTTLWGAISPFSICQHHFPLSSNLYPHLFPHFIPPPRFFSVLSAES